MGFRWLLRSLQLALIAKTAYAAFSLTESGNNFIVDTNAGLIFTVQRNTGDITSLRFNGIEVQDQGSKKSHINSGLGASCTHWRGGNSNNYIKITCTAGSVTQYYIARYNDPAIHMATYTTAQPSVGELRFIARLRRAAVPNGYRAAEIVGGTAIEGSDVFRVGSETRSKYYSSRQFIDDKIHGVTGPGIGVWMIITETGYESSSGGPFMRDINNQGGDQQELYYYMNSGHTQTENFRTGFHGPYALWFTTGAQPSESINTLFWQQVDIPHVVPTSGRGRVTGRASGVPSNFAGLQVVGFSNGVAQYWTRASSNGQFTSPYMKPGTYVMTLYKVELAVASQTVTIGAGSTITSNIASTESNPSVIWQLGDFDGTPRGFLNAEYVHFSKIETMHPSDPRMRSWGPVTFNVGDSIGNFPMALFKAIGPVTIRFNLNSNQLGARTLEIGTTLAFAGGRPQVRVNNWNGPNPPAPSQPNSRGVTRGTWRGNNTRYVVNIPAGTLVAGTNTIVINVISGSSGDGFL
ncbi:rhamnogalacturonase B [Coprinopsis cinerea okayama7|uniref:rhamnogalacturonan endolyase n=1 Tax=Coprinopsis cinerea (strain Okayama-7 / 130 / ATCC MYA-4618 / FGSC 9003) TaxID=240176 RepID=A8PCK0_COPC7|nr:rhamnogalacturonase B [Coprinopsis cinerea okayama7\|eukprot:XP_001840418.2 rhamnogalacturonase B [Coprinopsis cinerea okayama7\